MSLAQEFLVPHLYRHTDNACHSPWGQVDHRGLGILEDLAHPEIETLGENLSPSMSTSPSSQAC